MNWLVSVLMLSTWQGSADDRSKMSKLWNFMTICDVIKQNQSEVGNIDFKI